MWSDFVSFVRKLLGLGTRRISMDPEYEADRLRAARRWRLLFVAALVVGLIAWFAARPVSRYIKGRHADSLVREGETLFAVGEFEEAMKRMESAGALAPVRPSVLRLRARLMSAYNLPGAAAAWADLVRQTPEDEAVRIEWVIALLRADQREAAAKEFQLVSEAGRASARGRLASGMLVYLKGDARAAEAAIREAARLDASDLVTRLELGRLLVMSNAEAEGRSVLEDLRTNPRFRRAATLLLIEAARRRADYPAALTLARELAAARNAEPVDLPRVLDLLRETKDETGLEAALQEAIPLTLRDRRASLALLVWLVEQRQHERALLFQQALPAEFWTAREFVPVLGLLLTRRADDLARLKDLLRRGDWSLQEAFRLACTARQAEWERDPPARRDRWTRALALAVKEPAALPVLQRCTREWNWPREQLAVLREIGVLSPQDRVALRAWYDFAAVQRDTVNVADAARALLAAGENSLQIRNDYATANLLLGQDMARAAQIALENYNSQPGGIVYVGTYAGSLRLLGRPADALRVLDEADTRGLKHPALTFERALALQALGRRAEAREIVEKLPAADRLPEHNALLKRLKEEG
ncbi:MAG: hypothetical protein JSR82_01220 [Verrucomicrobia bacterium]|nr:hypothetical protein [Verrucomicrobiota bacterium]